MEEGTETPFPTAASKNSAKNGERADFSTKSMWNLGALAGVGKPLLLLVGHLFLSVSSYPVKQQNRNHRRKIPIRDAVPHLFSHVCPSVRLSV